MTKTDRGLYRCVADNQVRPPDEYLVAVNVFFKPDTIAVQDSVGQAADRQFDAKLECRVSGIYRTAHDHQRTCFVIIHIAPDKAAYCVFTQFRGPDNAIKLISVRTKTQ